MPENDRKARLAALRKRKQQLEGSSAADAATESSEQAGKKAKTDDKPVIKFRNYTPVDESLSQKKLLAKPLPSDTIVKAIEEQTEEIVHGSKLKETTDEKSPEEEEEEEDSDDEEVQIVPKKANWDLKRDVEKKLAKLARQTQRAINEMIKEKQEAAEEEDSSSSGESGSDSSDDDSD